VKHINDWHIKIRVNYFKPYDRRDTRPLDKALLKFNKKIKEVALMPELQENMNFISKSERKRNKKRIGRHRKQKQQKGLE